MDKKKHYTHKLTHTLDYWKVDTETIKITTVDLKYQSVACTVNTWHQSLSGVTKFEGAPQLLKSIIHFCGSTHASLISTYTWVVQRNWPIKHMKSLFLPFYKTTVLQRNGFFFKLAHLAASQKDKCAWYPSFDYAFFNIKTQNPFKKVKILEWNPQNAFWWSWWFSNAFFVIKFLTKLPPARVSVQ